MKGEKGLGRDPGVGEKPKPWARAGGLDGVLQCVLLLFGNQN